MKQVKLFLAAIITITMFSFALCGIDSAQADFKDNTSFDLPGSPIARDITTINTKKNTLDSTVNAKGFKLDKINSITLNNLTVIIDAKSPDSSALVNFGALELVELTLNGVKVASKTFDANDVSKKQTFTTADFPFTKLVDLLKNKPDVQYEVRLKTRKAVPRITAKVDYNALIDYTL